MNKVYIVAILTALSFSLQAQKISGIIKDETGKPTSGVTVSLLRLKDSIAAKFAATKPDGQYVFVGVQPGNYLIKATHVGYSALISGPVAVGDEDVVAPAIVLKKLPAELQGVTVTSKKPMVEVKADKTILNIEGTINSIGSDGLELLRKAPGVLVDKDDNLSLAGKNGVQVYIDGRRTPLAGKDLADFLKTVQSSEIEAIEIITNPSAKYEAAGNAGIINIRLKKNKSFGTNGSVNAGWAIGIKPKYNGGFSLNNRNKKTNLFGSYNYNLGNNRNKMDFYRTLADTIFDQHTLMDNNNEGHSYKAGMDVFLDAKNTIGVIVNGNTSENSNLSTSNTNISYQPTGVFVKQLVANNSSTGNRSNINANLNYRYGGKTRELNVDGDYGYYHIFSNQLQPNDYYDQNGNKTSSVSYNMISPTNIKITSVKADYEQDFKKGKLGIGAKSSLINTNNDFQRYNMFTNSKVLDTLRSNRFDYDENINALYVNYNRQWKGFVLQAGVRGENTVSKGQSIGSKYVAGQYQQYDSSFKKPYIDFFPSMAITFNKNPKSQLGFTYSRRIDRPAYQDLNPFEMKLDEYTYLKGNTQLRPQYTNSFGITHTYNYKLNTRLNYSHVKDIFSQLIDTAEISKTFMSKRNLATQDIISLNISYPYQYKKFSAFFNTTSNYSKYKANFGNGRTVDLDAFAVNVFTQASLKIGKTWTAEMSGWYNSPTIWQGTFKSKAMGAMDMGVQKQILKGKGNIKASFTDVFKTMHWSGVSDFAGQVFKGSGNFESQQLRVNFSYRFGNSLVKAARQRKNAQEEEPKRTQGG
ncbi:MAG: outer membrane beta-barrel protein, partial [Ferruginibacter sp.]